MLLSGAGTTAAARKAWLSPEQLCRLQQYALFAAVLSAIGFVMFRIYLDELSKREAKWSPR